MLSGLSAAAIGPSWAVDSTQPIPAIRSALTFLRLWQFSSLPCLTPKPRVVRPDIYVASLDVALSVHRSSSWLSPFQDSVPICTLSPVIISYLSFSQRPTQLPPWSPLHGLDDSLPPPAQSPHSLLSMSPYIMSGMHGGRPSVRISAQPIIRQNQLGHMKSGPERPRDCRKRKIGPTSVRTRDLPIPSNGALTTMLPGQ